MVRQLSLDQFENESRRTIPMNNDSSFSSRKFIRQKSVEGLHKKVISHLLRPRNWKAPTNRKFFLDLYEVGELCHAEEQIFMNESTFLQLRAPIKVFGDLHGQFGDLVRLFDEYGFPSTTVSVKGCVENTWQLTWREERVFWYCICHRWWPVLLPRHVLLSNLLDQGKLINVPLGDPSYLSWNTHPGGH